MKKNTKILITGILIAISFIGFANMASAVATLASFNPNPLFSSSNFIPGDKAEANITINNTTEIAQIAYIEAVNILNSANLASQMNLKIFEGETKIYDDNFGTFLNAGPVLLSNIGIGSSKTYNLKITFLGDTSNDYQSKTLGFDICVGFSGGDQHCTSDIVVSEEEGTISSGGGSGGSGGSTSGSHRLIIFNESATNISVNEPIPDSGSATIIWETNIPATSQVIYGLASGAPYTLDLNIEPGFGYPLSTLEDLTKVINHSMFLTGLIPGETYVYRVVSRASPATISYEYKFTVPISQNSNSLNVGPSNTIGDIGEILGASSGDEKEKISNLASVFVSGWGDLISACSLWSLIILFIGYLVWRFWFR